MHEPDGPKAEGPRARRRGRGEPPRRERPEAAARQRMYVSLPEDLKRRWETWCAWHRADSSELISAFISQQTAGMVVQMRPGAAAAEAPGHRVAPGPVEGREAG